MDVRPANDDDIPAVLPMVRKIAAMHERMDPAKYTFRADPGEMYRGWLATRAHDPASVFLVADAGAPAGRLAGFLVATVEQEIPIYRLRQMGFIHDLWVEEEYRNEGIGRQLVMTAIARFREIGVSQVRGDTAWANDPARNLLKTCGFRPSIVEMLVEVGAQGTEARRHEVNAAKMEHSVPRCLSVAG